ncbi:MAG: alpha/beta hydrolase fold domain-containing protein [Pseudomonadota bacterium]
MSVALRALNAWLRLTEKPFLSAAQDIPSVRRSFEQKAKFLFWPPQGCAFTETRLADRPSVLIRPPQINDPPVSVFYLHGGAYLFGSPRTHRAMVAKLCSMGGFEAVLPSYRLAPEDPFPCALEDALGAYEAWRAQNQNVVIGGDSAGGGLALALLAEIIRLGLEPPIGLFTFSPLTDLTGKAPSLQANAATDVILPADRMPEIAGYYLSGAAPANPRASPLFADFHNAPPVWMTVSDAEILLDDARSMASRLQEQGVKTDLQIEQDLPHGWPIFHNYLPEARVTLAALARWIRQLATQAAGS